MDTQKFLIRLASTFLMASMLASCNQVAFETRKPEDVPGTLYDQNPPDGGKTPGQGGDETGGGTDVPDDGGTTPGACSLTPTTPVPLHGLLGTARYLPDSLPRYTDVGSFIQNGTLAPQRVYLKQLNIATQVRSHFETDENVSLTDQGGQLLQRDYAFELVSLMALKPNEEEGLYQFALLSGDGATMILPGFADYTWDETGHILNDGVHPARLACATKSSIWMSRDTKFPMRIRYFHSGNSPMTLTLLWRKWPVPSSAAHDPLCDQEGDSLFYDMNQNPVTPTQSFNDLLSRGWKVVDSENLFTPPQKMLGCP